MATIRKRFLLPVWFIVLVTAACGQVTNKMPSSPLTTAEEKRFQVVATTAMIADVARQVAGDAVDITALIPPGSNIHGYRPTPQDIARIAEADLLLINGVGLEEFIEPLLENAGGQARVVTVSEDVPLRDSRHDGEVAETTSTGEAHTEADSEEEHAHSVGDPHVWTDPNNVIIWVNTIETVLSELDSAHAATYQAQAERYRAELTTLDDWTQKQIARIPIEERKMVTDHPIFGYFAERYGITQVGAVIPSYSTLAEPSAQELAALETAISELGVKAVFVGATANPMLAQRVADDTGIQLVPILSDTLTDANGLAPTYVEYIRHNVTQIVQALGTKVE